MNLTKAEGVLLASIMVIIIWVAFWIAEQQIIERVV